MKKLITSLLIIVSVFGYGQTLQSPTYNATTTNTLKIKTPATVSTVNFLSTNEADGSVSKIAPINVNIPYTPVNYSAPTQTIGNHLLGIDTRLGQISTTGAGLTQRVYFTADNTVVNAVTYFASSISGKGSTATGSPPALVLPDNTKAFFAKDVIGIAQPSSTIGYAGTYGGNLTVSATPTPIATQQRFTVEIYRTNNLGTPIASGVSGAPTGDLGVTVLAILDSGIINLSAGSITNVPVSGILTQNVTINTGERLRYHVSAAKIGTGGGSVTFGVYYGTSYNSYYDVPVAITTDAVLNKSVITGITSSDALNLLNTDKVSSGSAGVNGRVPFWTGSNSQSSDASLFWDNTSKSLGIGQNAPAVALDISGNSFATTQFRSTSISNTDNSVLAFRRSRSSVSAVQANDILGSLSWRGHDGTSYGSDVASIFVGTLQNYTPSIRPSYISFKVTPNNSATMIQPLDILGNGVFVNYDFISPTNVQAGFNSKVLGKGDNTTYKGVAAITGNAEDRPDVTISDKGVLIGGNFSVKPIVVRNNVPFDDAVGAMFNNEGSVKATDALYISKNPSFSGSQWIATLSSDANADHGIVMNGNYTVSMLRLKDKFVVDNNGLTTVAANINPSTNNAVALGTDANNYSFVRSNMFTSNTALTFDTPNNNSIAFNQGGVQKMRMFNTGRIVLQNGGTFTDNGVDQLQITGTASGTVDATLSNQFVRKGQVDALITSGSYTPTLTATANCSALTLTSAFYQKVGNIVSVSILARGTTTTTNTLTSFTATLPINKATITPILNGSFNLGFGSNSDIALGYCSTGQTTVSCVSSTLTSSGSNAYFIINFYYDVTQ